MDFKVDNFMYRYAGALYPLAHGRTLREAAQMCGLSRARVRQVADEAIRRLYEQYLKDHCIESPEEHLKLPPTNIKRRILKFYYSGPR